MKNQIKRLQIALGLLALATLNWQLSTAFAQSVTFTTQPKSLYVTNGAPAAFNIAVSGTAPFYYQWQKNGSNLSDGGNISGSLTTNLSLSTTTTNDGGSYTAIVTNSYGSMTSSVAKLTLILQGNVVTNGGFETGDFSGWTLSGNTNSQVEVTTYPVAHSGTYGAAFGPQGSLAYLSQALATIPGGTYLFSFWLNSQGGTPTEFLVAWNGQTIFDQVNMGATGWTNMQFIVSATTSSTLLQFGFQNDPAFFFLDDVTCSFGIFPPKIQTVTATGGNFQFSWNKVSTYPAVGYQARYTTNLASTNWINLGGVLTGSGPTITATDTNRTNAHRFYQVLLVQ